MLKKSVLLGGLLLAVVTSSFADPSAEPMNAVNNPANSALMQSGIWKDPSTGLTWLRCSIGQAWDGNTCVGTPQIYTWSTAQAAVQALNQAGGMAGKTDWRVPTIAELSSLRQCTTGQQGTNEIPNNDNTTVRQVNGPNNNVKPNVQRINEWCKAGYRQPDIAENVFPNTPAATYWSSSPNVNYSQYAWGVHFGSGYTLNHYYNTQNFVRAVRND